MYEEIKIVETKDAEKGTQKVLMCKGAYLKYVRSAEFNLALNHSDHVSEDHVPAT